MTTSATPVAGDLDHTLDYSAAELRLTDSDAAAAPGCCASRSMRAGRTR
ncbi:hypothetical protein [Streptomyces sp. NPDC059008]